MKKSLLSLLILGLALSLGGCFKDDFEDLQNQIDDLDNKIENLEQAQQQALLEEIAKLQASIVALQAENAALQDSNSELDAQYAAMLAELEALENTVANNANAVYYGDLITDEDFAAVEAQGATVVTGKAVPKTQAHADAMATVRMLGGNIELGASLDLSNLALENVSGDVVISGVNTTEAVVEIPALTSVGGNFLVKSNMGLNEIVVDNLVIIYGQLSLEEIPVLTTISASSLDVVNEIYINNYDANDPNYVGQGQLTNIDLSDANVSGSVDINYIGAVSNLIIGNIGGDFNCNYTGIDTLTISGTMIEGDLSLQYNSSLGTVMAETLSEIGGDLVFYYNDNSWTWPMVIVGLETMPSFDALTTIGGNVSITYNGALKTLDAFHNVTEVNGNKIEISANGNSSNTRLVNVFSSLVETGGDNSDADITINQSTEWFNGFNALDTAKNVYVWVDRIYDPLTYNYSDVCKVDGFDALAEVNNLTLNAKVVTEFNAFGSLDNFKSTNTYMTIEMPNDTSIGMCSMDPIFTRIKNGDFDTGYFRKAIFNYNWSPMDRDLAIDQLLAPCTL